MKLVNAKYSININMEENIVDILVIENRKAMSDIVFNFWNQSNGFDGDFVLSEIDEVKIEKNLEVVINPFQLDFNNRKIIAALYSKLAIIGNELVTDKNQINANNIQVLDKIIAVEKYSGIEYNLEFEWNEFFKLYGVRISSAYDSLAEKLIEYIKIMSTLSNIKIICFVNIKSYLTEKELLDLYLNASYNKVQLILIESVETKNLENERLYIIDSDMCNIKKF